MAVFEIIVDVKVRKTLRLAGPVRVSVAQDIVQNMFLTGNLPLGDIQKWECPNGIKPIPVETIIDNDPQIVAVREV